MTKEQIKLQLQPDIDRLAVLGYHVSVTSTTPLVFDDEIEQFEIHQGLCEKLVLEYENIYNKVQEFGADASVIVNTMVKLDFEARAELFPQKENV